VPEQEGSLNGQDSTVVVTYDQNFTFPVPVSADATKTFLGWYYGDIAYTDPFGESKNVWNNETDITLTPRWVEVFKFTLTKSNNEDCYSVTKGGGISYVKEVTVPATYNGVKVGVIEAECFKECTRLEVVNIPNTILEISIGDGGSNGTACCFYKCTSLKEVNIYTADERADANYWSTDDGILIQRNTKTGDIEVCSPCIDRCGCYTFNCFHARR
jgi:hypothetical protein